MKELVIAYIKSEDNIADLMTKVLGGGEKRDKLVQSLMYDIT